MTAAAPDPALPSERLDRARQTLADIAKRARATNVGRARELEALLMAAVAGENLTEGQRRSAQRAAHMIAGSAGTIGMHQVSELARDLESAIVSGSISQPAGLLHAVGLLREIQRRLEDEAGDALTATEPTVEGRREILVVTSDDAKAASIAEAAEARGWASRWAVDVASARAALRRSFPDVVILDAALEPLNSGNFLLGSVADRPRLPTVVLGTEDHDTGRAAAARAGADAYGGPEHPPESLVAIAIDAAGLPPAEATRVLALADPGTADALEAALLGPAFELTALAERTALETTLHAGSPDLLVVAVDGPEDLELCQRLSRDPRSAAAPLIAVTSRLPEDVARAYRAGADDVVGFPLVPDELVSTVSAWAARSHFRRHARESNAAAGLVGRAAASAAFERLTAEARQLGSPMSVALLDVDGLRALNQEHGYAFGDLVLRRIARLLISSLREEDVVARWAGQEYVVLMPGLRKADAVARLAAVLESLRNHTFVSAGGGEAFATFSGAVAEHPADGDDLPALVKRAHQVLGSAKRAGGNRVLPLGWTPQPVRNSTDVFIVEDDEMLAGLLQQALDTRGLRSEHETDGRVALERLTGPNRLSAKVILLDVDLPGMNGLDVLRRLEAEGILQHSHVIMLTAYAGEQDVITAMRHGAFDHAAKPFSLPVLTQRLRRALDSLPPS